MDGGSIIRPPCPTTGVAGTSWPPLRPATAISRPIRCPPFIAAVPSASRPPICASSKAVGSCYRSTPCVEEDPSLDKEEEAEKREKSGIDFSAHSFFGPVPSKEEAEAAISAIQLISLPRSFSEIVEDEANSFTEDAFNQLPLLAKRASSSSFDHSEPGQLVYKSNSVLSQAQDKVLNALRLLRINPSVQSMVVSLSTDKAVWNAIMKNEMVQELKKSYHADKYLKYVEYAARGKTTKYSDACPDITAQILSWLFENAKAKMMNFIDDIISLVNKLFHPEGKETNMDVVSEVVRSSFMLSVLVFIVVILKRIA